MSIVYSWDMPQAIYGILHKQDIKRGFRLIELTFNNYPKEEDSIIMIILKSIQEEVSHIHNKLILETLMNYYLYLLKEHISLESD